MNTSSKMSDKESYEENENIVMNLNHMEDKQSDQNRSNNFFHIKLDIGENMRNYNLNPASKRNITQKRRPDYEDYLDKSSSVRSKKKKRSIGKLL